MNTQTKEAILGFIKLCNGIVQNCDEISPFNKTKVADAASEVEYALNNDETITEPR